MANKAFDSRPCHGFREARSEAAPEMRASENAMLRHARIVNGAHPQYQNGYGRGFSRRACLRPIVLH